MINLLLVFFLGLVLGVFGRKLARDWISREKSNRPLHKTTRTRSSRPPARKWVLKKKKSGIKPFITYICFGGVVILLILVLSHNLVKYIDTRRSEQSQTKKTPIVSAGKIRKDAIVRRTVPVPEQRPSVSPPTPEPRKEIPPQFASYPYALKLGSFKTIERAKKAMRGYEKKGFEPYWVKVLLKEKGSWYRIYSGYFKNIAEAEEYKMQRGLKDAAVKKTQFANLIGVYTSTGEIEVKLSLLKGLNYCPYVIKNAEGASRILVGAFLSEEGVKKQFGELKSDGIESRIIER
ncbi:SPOR domain-containing protein [Thermodesulfobacteriota bacterium]